MQPAADRSRLYGSSFIALSAAGHRRLRRRLVDWAREELGMSEAEFEDRYQDACCVAVRVERREGELRNLEGIMKRALERRWKDELRRRGRHPTAPLDEDALDVAPYAGVALDPADEVELQESSRFALEVVGTVVNARRQQVLKLRHAFGLSVPEVCRLMGISERTYRKLHSARQRSCARGSSCSCRGAGARAVTSCWSPTRPVRPPNGRPARRASTSATARPAGASWPRCGGRVRRARSGASPPARRARRPPPSLAAAAPQPRAARARQAGSGRRAGGLARARGRKDGRRRLP